MDDKDIYLNKEQSDNLQKVIANNEIPEDWRVTSLTSEDFKKSDNKEIEPEESNINAVFVAIITLIIFCGFALIFKLGLDLFKLI